MSYEKMGKKLAAFMLASVMVISTGCASSTTATTTAAAGQDKSTIKIGTSFPMTGTVAADGKYIVNAINFAVDQCNEAGGINGRKVEVV